MVICEDLRPSREEVRYFQVPKGLGSPFSRTRGRDTFRNILAINLSGKERSHGSANEAQHFFLATGEERVLIGRVAFTGKGKEKGRSPPLISKKGGE